MLCTPSHTLEQVRILQSGASDQQHRVPELNLAGTMRTVSGLRGSYSKYSRLSLADEDRIRELRNAPYKLSHVSLRLVHNLVKENGPEFNG